MRLMRKEKKIRLPGSKATPKKKVLKNISRDRKVEIKNKNSKQ